MRTMNSEPHQHLCSSSMLLLRRTPALTCCGCVSLSSGRSSAFCCSTLQARVICHMSRSRTLASATSFRTCRATQRCSTLPVTGKASLLLQGGQAPDAIHGGIPEEASYFVSNLSSREPSQPPAWQHPPSASHFQASLHTWLVHCCSAHYLCNRLGAGDPFLVDFFAPSQVACHTIPSAQRHHTHRGLWGQLCLPAKKTRCPRLLQSVMEDLSLALLPLVHLQTSFIAAGRLAPADGTMSARYRL